MKTQLSQGERLRRVISQREFPTSRLSADLRASATSYARRRASVNRAEQTTATRAAHTPAGLGLSASYQAAGPVVDDQAEAALGIATQQRALVSDRSARRRRRDVRGR